MHQYDWKVSTFFRVHILEFSAKAFWSEIFSKLEYVTYNGILFWREFFGINSLSIEDDVIQIQSRSFSDPSLSDIDFKNKMAWVWNTLKGPY